MSLANFQGTSPLPFRANDTTVIINRIVKLVTTAPGTVVGAAAATDVGMMGVAVGLNTIATTTPTTSVAGDQVAVQDLGVGLVEAGAGVTCGDYITTDNSSRGITASSGQYVIGRALETAGGAGELIGVQLCVGGLKMP